MITFALPWVLAVAVAGAMAVAALHWLSVRRPPELLLPTARFLPERDVRAVSRTRRPSDLWLLLLRVLLVLAAGVAIAGPAWNPSARTIGVVAVVGPGVMRDTVAIRQMLTDTATDASASPEPVRIVFVDSSMTSATPATLTALFPVAIRAATALVRDDAAIDSLDLHLFAREGAADGAAFDAWRAAWNGRVVLHVASDAPTRRQIVLIDATGERIDGGIDRRTDAAVQAEGAARGNDDVVTTALAWHAARVSRVGASRVDTIQVVRGESGVVPTTARTSARTSAQTSAQTSAPTFQARLQVQWPVQGVPTGWRTRDTVDSAAAIAIGGAAIDGPWVVRAEPDTVTGAIPIAWFSNGIVAANEVHRAGDTCIRRVGVEVVSGSDALIAATANRFFDRLLAACAPVAPLAGAALSVRSVHGSQRAPAASLRERHREANGSGAPAARRGWPWITPALLGLSVLLLLVEWRVRGHQSPVAS